MFTRRQAIRWAELWLSCWTDGDFDTLLAMHKDGVRFGEWSSSSGTGESRMDPKEAMKRHWAALPFGLHSAPAELDEVAWDPEAREVTVIYVTDFGFSRVRGCDLLTLDSTGRVIAGEPCMGAVIAEQRAAGTYASARDWFLSENTGGR